MTAALFVGALPTASEAVDRDARVRDAALDSYVHGMTEQIAREKVGPAGVPSLLMLLQDPLFSRRDNLVAFLAYLGGTETTPALLRLLQHPPVPIGSPDEERALLLVPHALGHLARRGEPAALDALLEMSAPPGREGLLDAAGVRSRLPDPTRETLREQAVLGLAWAGRPSALARLRALAEGAGEGPQGSRMGRAARDALELHAVLEAGSTTAVPQRVEARGAGVQGFEPDAADQNARSHASGLTYGNHVDLGNPMTDDVLDRRLADATLVAGLADFQADVACCIRVERSGGAKIVGAPGDGLDVIDNERELDTVLGIRSARVKVVRLINSCSGPGTNILGCSYTPGNGIVLVRTGTDEDVLWLHEFGHNTGLLHNPDASYVMHAFLRGSNVGLTQAECTRFHAPQIAAGITPREVGACVDDGDDYSSTVDNCPAVGNPTQADSDGDGVGDACDACGGPADPDGDGRCGDQDNCPDDANPGQEDRDADGSGDACDACTDADDDGYGDPGASACGVGSKRDCDDGAPAVHPGAADLCDSRDNDCNGSTDDARCREFDVTGDDRVDGAELAWIGRAFGACAPAGASPWWAAVDYSADRCVDGDDLAVLSSLYTCEGVQPVCP